MILFTPLSLAWVIAAAPAAPETTATPRVGVVVSTAVNLTMEAQIDVSERLGRALADALKVDVTAGREVSRRLEGISTGPECFLDANCKRRVASRLEVDQLLVLVAVRLGTRLQIEPTWIDIPADRSVVRDAIVTDAVKDDLSDVLIAAASRLLPDAEPRSSATAPPESERSMSQVMVQTATVSSRPPGPPLATWVSFGLAASSLAVGVGLGVSASNGYDQLEADGCRETACEPARIDAVDRSALAADVMFGVAGVSVLTGLLWWWMDADERPIVAVVPGGHRAMRVSVGGRF